MLATLRKLLTNYREVRDRTIIKTSPLFVPVSHQNELVQILPYDESIERITDLLPVMQEELNAYHPLQTLPAMAFILLLRAEQQALFLLNDPYINCAVPWDAASNFPSHPTMIADAQKFAGTREEGDFLKVVLNSFLQWTGLTRETILCACGSTYRERDVTLTLMMNHCIFLNDTALHICQLIGVESNDPQHLQCHYSPFRVESVRDRQRMIIWMSENAVRFHDGCLAISHVKTQRAEQFNAQEFLMRMQKLITKLPLM